MVSLEGCRSSECELTTSSPHSGHIATERVGGMISATGSTLAASGADSLAIYSTGDIRVAGGGSLGDGCGGPAIAGTDRVTLTDSAFSPGFADKWGVLIYRGFSSRAHESQRTFHMIGGSLTCSGAYRPLFYLNNATG